MFGGIRVVREITVGIVDNDRFVLPSLKASIEELSDDMQVIWTTSDGGHQADRHQSAAASHTPVAGGRIGDGAADRDPGDAIRRHVEHDRRPACSPCRPR